jgi:hypothetical protein
MKTNESQLFFLRRSLVIGDINIDKKLVAGFFVLLDIMYFLIDINKSDDQFMISSAACLDP